MLEDPKHLPAQLRLPPDRFQRDAGARYVLDARPRLAVRMAWATKRPLLVIGEAGSGKTQLAAALAQEWQVPLLATVINGQSQLDDLQYQFDAVARLADAQISAARLGTVSDVERHTLAAAVTRHLAVRNYLRPGPLWWAWNWMDAQRLLDEQAATGHLMGQPPPAPMGWQPGHGCVVLIDEIDKAGIELPEGLLDVLDTGGFDVPWSGQRVSPPNDESAWCPPLVIITSNGARDLPAPFLRRCIALEMTVPVEGLVPWLVGRARAHFGPTQCSDAAVVRAAELIVADREAASRESRYIPGVSEFLDLLAAVAQLEPGSSPDAQVDLIRQFAPAVTEQKGKAAYQ